MANASDIQQAVERGELSVVTTLLQAGGDPNQAALDGTTCLHLAAAAGNQELLSALLQFQARCDTQDRVRSISRPLLFSPFTLLFRSPAD